MRWLILISLIFVSSNTYAYNWRRCKAFIKKPNKPSHKITSTSPIEKDLWYTTFGASSDVTTDYTIGSMASVTSYFSSTGPCRAFGMAEKERIRYVASTQNELQSELAEGHGEHLIALATLYGCNDLGKTHFPKVIRQNYSQIFSTESRGAPEMVTYQILENVADSGVLSSNCDPEMI